jgi:hypothetical protein
MTNYSARPWNSEPDDEDDLWDDDPWEDDDAVVRVPALSLTGEQQRALAAAIAAGLEEHGCDGTLRAVRRWAAQARVRWSTLKAELRRGGGFCDCEVVLNVAVIDEPEPD